MLDWALNMPQVITTDSDFYNSQLNPPIVSNYYLKLENYAQLKNSKI